jgi:hypothetical protein
MKDYLLDVVQHTHNLGFIELVKITGDDGTTTIEGIAEDRSVILKGKFHKPVPEFMGTFGMPNLATLSVILRIPEYAENEKISINTQERNGETVPVGIHFENSSGDFQNDYRFMSSEVVNDKLKSVTMKNVNWGVEFEPTVASVQRLKMMISANSEEKTFIARTEGNDLKFAFGDASTHAGEFVFQPDVVGSVSKGWAWPVEQVSKILGLSGDLKYSISDDGVSQISVDSGLGVYNYLLPAQTK